MYVQCPFPYLIFSRVFGIFVETFALGEKRMKRSMRGLLGTLFLRLLLETGPPFYLVIWATWRSRHLQDKGSTFISQSFLRPWVLVWSPESNPWPPALVVKCSTDWANPAAVKGIAFVQAPQNKGGTEVKEKNWIVLCVYSIPTELSKWALLG